MSTQRLGRAKNLENYWSEGFLDTSESIDIYGISKEIVEPLANIVDYPYSNQLKISGTFIYSEVSREGGHTSYEGEYEYRSGSGLFLINGNSDRIRQKKVFKEINNHLSGEAKLHRALSLDRSALWEFLTDAHRVKSLEIKTDRGTYDAVNLMELLRHSNPIEKLQNWESDRPANVSVLKYVLMDIENPQKIDTLFDLDLDLLKTTIKKAEATYFDGSDFADLKFEGGILSVEGDTTEAREYVLQKFERDVIYPSYG